MSGTFEAKTAQTYSLVVTLAYFTIYSLVFLATSVYCAYVLNEDIKHNKIQISKNKQKPNNNDTTTTQTANADQEMKPVQSSEHDDVTQEQIAIVTRSNDLNKKDNIAPQTPVPSISIFSLKFLKLWRKSVWQKKSIYISIVPHLFDQATDLGVLIQYYRLWKHPNPNYDIDARYWFFSSIAIIILHKVVSSCSVWLLSGSIKDVIYQFFDVYMVKAVYVNYLLGCDEPSSGQRYLQILEGTFESGPQILIGMTFILKTVDLDAIVLVSLITSLWTLTARIASDDKSVLKEHWKRIDFSYKRCPPMNLRYIFRVFFWRFAELTNKVTLYSLIWVVMGGFSLIIIVLFEFACCAFLSYLGESFLIMGNMLYFTVTDGALIRERVWHSQKYGGTLLAFARFYRFFSLYSLLIIITILAAVPNDDDIWKVPENRDDVFQNLSLGIFIYCWATAFIWPCSLAVMGKQAIVLRYTGRDPLKLLEHEQYDDLLQISELTGVGMLLDYTAGGYNIVEILVRDHNLYTSKPDRYEELQGCFKLLTKICFELQSQERMGLWLAHFDNLDTNPIQHALVESRFDVIDLFIEHYYPSTDDLNSKKIKQRSLSDVCADIGSFESMKYLIQKYGISLDSETISRLSAKLNEQMIESGIHAMHSAAKVGDLGSLKFFIDTCGMDPNLEDANGKTCAGYAVDGMNSECIKCLVNAGVNAEKLISKSGIHAMHNAAKSGDLELLKFFIDTCGMDPKLEDANGRTCAGYATDGMVRNGYETECITFLVSDAGVNAEELISESGILAVHKAAKVGDLELLKLCIVTCGMDPKLEDGNGKTCAGYATDGIGSYRYESECIPFLVNDAGVNVEELISKSGIHAMYRAAKFGDLELLKFFIDTCGMDPNLQDANGKTCISYAYEFNIKGSHMMCIQYLQSHL